MFRNVQFIITKGEEVTDSRLSPIPSKMTFSNSTNSIEAMERRETIPGSVVIFLEDQV